VVRKYQHAALLLCELPSLWRGVLEYRGELVMYRALQRVDEAREALLSSMGKARASSNSMRQFHFGVNREFA